MSGDANGQSRLGGYGSGTTLDLDALNESERKAYVAVVVNGTSPAEFARVTDTSPRVVALLLKRARLKVEGSQ